jgi:hypothetical protein
MAIFVSNPTSAAVQTLSSDALEPSAVAPEEGFTEELAAAMQPLAGPSDGSAKTPLDMLEEAAKKASDLQILPAEVLKNAVGDANFALTGQVGASNSAAQNAIAGSVLTHAADDLKEDTTALDLANQLQGAELAAANLAAQMSASTANVAAPLASHAGDVSGVLSINATSGAGQDAGQALQAPATGPSLQEGEQVATLASAQQSSALDVEGARSANALAESQSTPVASLATSRPQVTTASELEAPRNLLQEHAASKANAASESQAQQAMSVASNTIKLGGTPLEGAAQQVVNVNQAATPAEATTKLSQTLSSEASSISAQASSDVVAANAAASTVGNASNTPTDSSQAASIKLSSATQMPGAAIAASDNQTVSSDSKVEVQAKQAQESAFNFDAKLAKSDALQNTKVLETPISLGGVAKSNVQLQQAGLSLDGKTLGVPATAGTGAQTGTQTGIQASAQISTNTAAAPEIDAATSTFSNAPSGIQSGRTGETISAAGSLPTANIATSNRLDAAAVSATNSNAAVIAQEAPRAETTQSLEDISSSFVSSLVGGPQRPVTTVMDWISMQSQERPAPVVPHEVRLDAGAVQLEIQKMVKQGGGHVVMELTPPDQSKFTIELKLDERGNALLIVEGVSDSTKTRLEQSAPNLREQFQQMGLELQLDMRQQGQSSSSSTADFWGAQERGSGDNNLASNGTDDSTKILTQREAGANRARETGSNQVYLYA